MRFLIAASACPRRAAASLIVTLSVPLPGLA